MINGVHHIALSTTNLDRLLSFYNGLLGLPILSSGHITPGNTAFERVVGLEATNVKIAHLGAGNVHIEVFEYAQPIPVGGTALRSCDVGIRHIAFDVTDIHAEYERLKAAGVKFLSEPQVMGDKEHDYGVRAVYCRDPDENIVELQEILPHSIVDKAHVSGMPY
jgi:catechol 2,3-dioxygenase-like lactoylglutathione lyase family enzyme